MNYNVNDKVLHRCYANLGVGIVRSSGVGGIQVEWPEPRFGNPDIRTYVQGSKSLEPFVRGMHSEPKLEPAMHFTAQQKAVLIAMLHLPAGTESRTDVLAARMGGVGNNVMAAIGLELRARGLVSSENDGEQYNLWHLTKLGRVAVSRLVNGQPLAKEKWIVWCPQSPKPPVVVHDSQAKAEEVAQLMAAKNSPHEFFACKLGAGFKLTRKAKPVEYVETLEKL